MTGLQKANFIEQLGEEFHAKKSGNFKNMNPAIKVENEMLLREMIGNTHINADKIVKLLLPKKM